MEPERLSEAPRQRTEPSAEERMRLLQQQMSDPELARRIAERVPDEIAQWKEDTDDHGVRFFEAQIDGASFVINSADKQVYTLKGEDWVRTDRFPPSVGLKLDEVRGIVRWKQDTDPHGVRYSEAKIGALSYLVTEQGAVYVSGMDGSWGETKKYPQAVAAKRAEIMAEIERAANVPRDEPWLINQLTQLRIAVEGRTIAVELAPSMNAQYFKRHDIPRERYDAYLKNMQRAATKLEKALGSRRGWNGSVRCDGECIVAQDSKTRVMAYPGFVLEQPLTPGKDKTMTLLDERGQLVKDIKVTRNTDDPNAARFAIFDFADATSNRRAYLRPDGSKAIQRTFARENAELKEVSIQWYDENEGSKGDHQRPTIVMMKSSADIELPARDGSPTTEKYTLSYGKHIIPAEGKPIEKEDYSPLKTKPEPERREALKLKAGELAAALKTPEAIGAWITSSIEYMPTGGLGTYVDKSFSRSIDLGSDGTEQKVHHPLSTLLERSGDCEDIAILAQYMLKNIGVKSQVVRQFGIHFVCVFLEERTTAEGKRYDMGVIDCFGYKRRTGSKGDASKPFRSPGEAMKDIWSSGHEGGGVGWERDRIKALIPSLPADQRREAEDYLQYLERIVKKGGGIMTLQAPKGVSYDKLPLTDDMFEYKDPKQQLDTGAYGFDEDWSFLVRKIK